MRTISEKDTQNLIVVNALRDCEDIIVYLRTADKECKLGHVGTRLLNGLYVLASDTYALLV